MLYDVIIRSSDASQTIVAWIEAAALVVEILAVLIIVSSVVFNVLHYAWRALRKGEDESLYRAIKARLSRSMLFGLEILVAADIVRTVALEATLESVVILGLLVLIRTFLGWALDVEVKGRWPWQSGAERD